MSNREVIDKLLDEKGIRKYFNVVVTADEVSRPKPDPEAFLTCAIYLKCLPEKCIVVEDSIFGVQAAKQAGMRCIAIPTGAYSKEELESENPDLVVNSIEERETILDFVLKPH
jgi:beta-phosphoglucomutase-like phosphatase (HAD superfamily)